MNAMKKLAAVTVMLGLLLSVPTAWAAGVSQQGDWRGTVSQALNQVEHLKATLFGWMSAMFHSNPAELGGSTQPIGFTEPTQNTFGSTEPIGITEPAQEIGGATEPIGTERTQDLGGAPQPIG